MVNIGSPDEAFKNYYLPVKGVGLGRLEFIIASHIGIHPNALIDYKKLKNGKKTAEINKILKIIEEKTLDYVDKEEFYVKHLALGIAKIAATFYPEEVIIRFSDFKTNEYRTLLGGGDCMSRRKKILCWAGAALRATMTLSLKLLSV